MFSITDFKMKGIATQTAVIVPPLDTSYDYLYWAAINKGPIRVKNSIVIVSEKPNITNKNQSGIQARSDPIPTITGAAYNNVTLKT